MKIRGRGNNFQKGELTTFYSVIAQGVNAFSEEIKIFFQYFNDVFLSYHNHNLLLFRLSSLILSFSILNVQFLLNIEFTKKFYLWKRTKRTIYKSFVWKFRYRGETSHPGGISQNGVFENRFILPRWDLASA